MRILLYILSSLVFLTSPVFSGVFTKAHLSTFEPYIVVHPPGYVGTGGPLDVKICIAPGSSTIAPPLISAIETWMAFSPITQNCEGCRLWEEGASGSTAPLSMESSILHELGHCAMGLGHVNWDVLNNSFTNSRDAATITAGTDVTRGSKDDIVSPLPGSHVIHWFRKADNNPFVIDGTVIDSATFTRAIIDLSTSGSLWPASGNRGVGDLLGLMNTQSVMYSGTDVAQRYAGLVADDINTVRLGMVGLDLTVGGGDDYTINLIYVGDCADADIEVRFESLNPGVPALCRSDLALIPTGLLEIHHRIVPAPGDARIILKINQDETWDVVFANGFEEGDHSQWIAVP